MAGALLRSSGKPAVKQYECRLVATSTRGDGEPDVYTKESKYSYRTFECSAPLVSVVRNGAPLHLWHRPASQVSQAILCFSTCVCRRRGFLHSTKGSSPAEGPLSRADVCQSQRGQRTWYRSGGYVICSAGDF